MFLRTILTAAAIAGVAVGQAAPSRADNDDPESDATFARLLDHSGVLFNFRLEKYQGQRYCRSVIDGRRPNDAIQELMRTGSYSFDVAVGITSAASVAYCNCTEAEQNGST
jgi:predicted secreted protein